MQVLKIIIKFNRDYCGLLWIVVMNAIVGTPKAYTKTIIIYFLLGG